MPNRYAIRTGYRHRAEPHYFDDAAIPLTYQPEVYRDAANVATRLGCTRIIDVGCGNASKLIALADRFDVIGIDYGPNVDLCRRLHPATGSWRECDLDKPGALPLSAEEWQGSVVICADVIEHVRAPEVLLDKLRTGLLTAEALLLSTPERELTNTQCDAGPPGNPAHVREWSIRELGALMRRAGFVHQTIGLTRAHDQSLSLLTILAVYTRTAELLDVVEDIMIDGDVPEAEDYALRVRLRRNRPAVMIAGRDALKRFIKRASAEINGQVRSREESGIGSSGGR
jgi:SAM-dependent methyltransferase